MTERQTINDYLMKILLVIAFLVILVSCCNLYYQSKYNDYYVRGINIGENYGFNKGYDAAKYDINKENNELMVNKFYFCEVKE